MVRRFYTVMFDNYNGPGMTPKFPRPHDSCCPRKKACQSDAVSAGSGAYGSIAAGRLSYRSPIGAALLGHRAGETVTVATPAGLHDYRIVAVG